MRLRLLILLAVLAAALPVLPVHAVAPLSTDALLFDSNRTGNYELFTARIDGSATSQRTDDETYDSFWPKLSPDRTQVLFQRTPAGVHDTDFKQAGTWITNVDG